MPHQEAKETFTVVAFRYNQHHSVAYQSVNTEQDAGILVTHSLRDLKADVISIRRVYETCPIPKGEES